MTFTYYNNIPDVNNDPKVDQPKMQTNNDSIEGIINIDHVGFNQRNSGGTHRQVTFYTENEPSVFPVIPPVLFTKIVNAIPQLFFYSGSQLQSQDQYDQTANGSTFIFGGIILKWGFQSIASASSHVTGTTSFTQSFPNNCYTVLATLSALDNSVAVSNAVISVLSFTTSQFTYVRNSTSGSSFDGFYWIAVGN